MPVLTRQRARRTRPVKHKYIDKACKFFRALRPKKKKASDNIDPCIDLENSNLCFLFLQQRGVVHGEKETYRRLGSPYNSVHRAMQMYVNVLEMCIQHTVLRTP